MTLLDPSRPTIIRTHDRMLFKQCRVLWHYKSPNRHNYTTVKPSIPLVFGTAIHAALEYSYKPELRDDPRLVVEAEAVAIFVNSFVAAMDEQYPDDVVNEHKDLGVAMLKHYFKYYVEEHKEWTFVKTEIPFSVAIPLKEVGIKVHDNVGYVTDDNGATYLAEYINVKGLGSIPVEVRYEGVLDLVPIKRSTNRAWVWDHKSTERLDIDGMQWLDQDDQVNAYYWVALKILKLDVEGILFNYLRKTYPPTAPRLLANKKSLSKDHSQKTTIELYEAAIAEHGFNPTEYADFLASYEPPTYFHREQITKYTKDLVAIEQAIVRESRAIISVGEDIYPTPNMLNCRNCPFQLPCKMRQRGDDDIQWIDTSGLYKKNTDYGKPVYENIPT